MTTLVVDQHAFDLPALLGLLVLEEDLDVADLARRHVAMTRLCEARGMAPSPGDLADVLAEWRQASGLEKAADTRSWMREAGVPQAALTLFAQFLWMEDALLDSLTDAEVTAYMDDEAASIGEERDVYIIAYADMAKAEAAAGALRAASGTFLDRARGESLHAPSRAQGGYLGRLTKDELPDGLAEAVFAMDDRDVAGPVVLGDVVVVCTAHRPPVDDAEAAADRAEAAREALLEAMIAAEAHGRVVQRPYLEA